MTNKEFIENDKKCPNCGGETRYEETGYYEYYRCIECRELIRINIIEY